MPNRTTARQSSSLRDSTEKDPRIAVGLIKLAEACSSQSRAAEAQTLADQAMHALDKAVAGAKSTSGAGGLRQDYYRAETQALVLNKAGAIYFAAHQYPNAERAYKRVIEIRESAAKFTEHPRGNEDFLKFLVETLGGAKTKLADAYADLARVSFVQGRFGEATDIYSKALDILESEFGENQPPVARGLNNLATAYAAQALYDKAEPLFRRALELVQQPDWPDKPEAATTFENYSLLLRKTGREAEASVMMKRANEIRSNSINHQR
jgi:tetratricopeptide (TPR) repeat protein